MKTPIRLALFAALAALPLLALAPAPVMAKSRRPVKVKVKRPRGKVRAGDAIVLTVRVKNRTKDALSTRLTLAIDGGETFHTEVLALARKERRRLTVPLLVPATPGNGEDDDSGERIRIVARVEDDADEGDEDDEDEDDVEVPVRPGDDAEWSRGRELFLANCSACHGEKGGELRGEDFDDWWEAVRGEEDDMPAFPAVSRDDVREMRLYVKDPNRPVDPTPPPPPPAGPPTWESGVRALLQTRCTACHGLSSPRAGVRTDTYAEAFADRSAIVDSVEKGRMPPGGTLPAAEVGLLRDWLDGGAPEK